MTPIPKLEAKVRRHVDDSGRPTRILAFAELTIGGAFVIHGIRILQHTHEAGDSKPFVVFPAEKGKAQGKKKWYDVANPSTPEAREAAIALILNVYAKTQETT